LCRVGRIKPATAKRVSTRHNAYLEESRNSEETTKGIETEKLNESLRET
jgi:hypothetical protein